MQRLPCRVNNLLNDSEYLQNLNLLIIGVGGIGCQLLKVLCKLPIGQLHIIDMDTIQISNLNRQFLFKSIHKGQSKSLTAKESILLLNPYLNIHAHHQNIKDVAIQFFKQFSYLIMALDNIQARNYVNKIGVRLGIPIIDAGTLGYKGNVHVVLPGVSRCYSCQPKVSSQKAFPVCTIRMRPEKPVHCVVWAKMLFEVLFGGEVNNDMKDLSVLAEAGDQTNLLKQLLHTQIQNIKSAKTDSTNPLTQTYLKKIHPIPLPLLHQTPTYPNLQQFDSFDSNKIPTQILIGIAKQSFRRLLDQKKKEGSVIFQKDDDVVVHFVAALGNLRMQCFSIQGQSFNQVKNIAGNIVPAIASTNSMVSGLQILQLLKFQLSPSCPNLHSYYIQNQSYKVRPLKFQAPIPTCKICSCTSLPVTLELNMKNTLFKDIVRAVEEVLEGEREEEEEDLQYSINRGQIQLYNSGEPNQKILGRGVEGVLGGAGEADFRVVDQDTSDTLFLLWVVHNETITTPQFSNLEQIQTNLSTRKSKPQPKPKPSQSSSDSDIIFEDDVKGQMVAEQFDDDIEIIAVKKNKNENENDKEMHQGGIHCDSQVKDQVKKRHKEI